MDRPGVASQGKRKPAYACGWLVEEECDHHWADGGMVLSHSGTIGTGWSEIRLAPSRGTALMVATNTLHGIVAAEAMETMIELLLEEDQ